MTRLLLLLCLAIPGIAAAQEPTTPVLRMELAQESAVVGQSIELRMTVLVPTWMTKPPEFPSFEATNVVVRLPEGATRPTTERVGSESWSGVVRSYRLSPMAVGRYRFAPQWVTVTYADPETRSPVTVRLAGEEVRFEGVMPEAARGLEPFLAANGIELVQRFEGDPENLEPGGAFTRIVSVRARGTSPMFLPPLVEPLGEQGLSAYPKEAVLSETRERDGLVGERVERVTYVAETPGRHRVPPISLRWYDLETETIQEAETEGFEIVSRGPLPGPLATFEWQKVGAAALFLLVLALLARPLAVRLGPLLSAWRARRREARLASEAHAFSELSRTLQAHDFGATLRALELWSARLPNLSRQQDLRIGAAMAPLGAALYGTTPGAPDEATWSAALRGLRSLRSECLATSNETKHRLPPLNPS